jgi:hypothetical protein
MSEIKELHYFNAQWNEKHRRYAHDQFALALRQLEHGIHRSGSALPSEVAAQGVRAMRDRLAMFEHGDQAYIDFFSRRVTPDHTHFGEITPAYSMLPVESLRHIRSLFPNILIVFLMRDPVQRIHSALNMRGPTVTATTNEKFRWALSEPSILERTRYDLTITNLRMVFPRERLFFGFYETLFCDSTIRALCEFLGLPFKPGDYKQHVNASAGQQRGSLSAEQIKAGMSALAETYAFCRREFGAAIPANWYG